MIGRREGKYSPQGPPLIRSESPFIRKIMAEIENDMAIANAVNKPMGDPVYSTFGEFFRAKKIHEMYRDLLKDLQKGF